MNDHDRTLAEALLTDDAELIRESEKGGSIVRDVLETMHGSRGFLNILVWIVAAVFAVVMFWGGYRFFTEAELGDRLTWGMICLFGIIANGMLKMWAWMEINRVHAQRDMRRIELRLAVLNDRLGGQRGGDGG